MSEKITHEQIRTHFKEKFMIGDVKYKDVRLIINYISQQEKQEKLDEYLRISYDRDIKAYSEIRKLNKLLELQDDLITELSKAEHAQSSYAIDYIKNKIKEKENAKI